MSLLNIGLQGLALQRDEAGAYEATIKSCGSMKSLREKASKHLGFKEAFQASVEAPRRLLGNVLASLQLKGKQVKCYEAGRDEREIVAALNSIDPVIEHEEDIPHAMAKLKDFPSLEKYFERHMTEGLYLLQFGKCEDESCCSLRCK